LRGLQNIRPIYLMPKDPFAEEVLMTLRVLAETAGLEQLVLGTDESFPQADIEPLSRLRAAELSNTTIEAVAEDNPRRLFSRLK
jgi:hypothetical protein